jgi:hypothetical protein
VEECDGGGGGAWNGWLDCVAGNTNKNGGCGGVIGWCGGGTFGEEGVTCGGVLIGELVVWNSLLAHNI